MKKDLLLELLTLIKDNTSILDKIHNIYGLNGKNQLEKLLNLTNEEILDILNTKYIFTKEFKICLCLSKYELNDEIKLLINKYIEKNNDNLFCILDLINNEKFINRNDTCDILDLILNINNRMNAINASKLTLKLIKQNRENILDKIKLVQNCKTPIQANCIKDIICHISNDDYINNLANIIYNTKEDFQTLYINDFINSKMINFIGKDFFNVIEIIANCEKDFQAKYINMAATNPEISIKNKLDISFLKIISNTKSEYHAHYIAQIMLINNELKNKKAIEIANLINNIEDIDKVINIYEVVYKLRYHDEKIMDIINIIIKCKKDYQTKYVAYIATSINATKSNHYIDFINSILKCSQEFQAKYIFKLSKETKTPNNINNSNFINLIINSKTEFEANCIYKIGIRSTISTREDVIELINVIKNCKNELHFENCLKIIKENKNNKDILNLLQKEINKSEAEVLQEQDLINKENINNLMSLNQIEVLINSLKMAEETEINKNLSLKVKKINKK